MKFSLLTYNVLFNKAFLKLEDVLKEHTPDIVCLQEVETNESNLQRLENDNYELADYSNSFIKFGKIYGVATYFNKKKFKFSRSNTFTLPRSLYEMGWMVLNFLQGRTEQRTILLTNLKLIKGAHMITIFNVHLSAIATNGARLKHLQHTLRPPHAKTVEPVIVAGDFNYYPYRRKKFEDLMLHYGLKEATTNISYTMEYDSVREVGGNTLFQKLTMRLHELLFAAKNVKFDYIFYKDLNLQATERLLNKNSDHFPVLSHFEFK